jgi:uncharacterized protein (DUF2384 family)
MATARARPLYPRTALAAASPPALGSREARERLSPAALRGFFAVMTAWQVRDEDARQLLGGVSRATFYEMKRQPERVCSVDELTRISYLIGIFKALNVLHGEALADRWMQLPNTNRLFGGATPLQFVVDGGIPALDQVRRLLDARRGL